MKASKWIIGVVVLSLFLAASVKGGLFGNRYPDPTQAKYNAAAYGSLEFYAVGEEGTLLYSTDGDSWQICDSPADGDYQFIYYTDAFYFKSDAEPYNLRRSIGGGCESEWVLVNGQLGNLTDINDLKIAPIAPPEGWNKGFVAALNGIALYSPSGTSNSWTQVLSSDSQRVVGVTYNTVAGEWMLKIFDISDGTQSGNAYPVYFSTSTNGVDWSTPSESGYRASGDSSISSCWNGTGQVWISRVSDGIVSSSNGISWSVTQPATSNDVFLNMQCYSSRCVAVVDDDEFWETDSCESHWDDVNVDNYHDAVSNFPIYGWRDVNNETFPVFLVGSSDGSLFASIDYDLGWAQEGITEDEAASFSNCDDIVYVDGKYLITCRHGVLISSSDGNSWDEHGYDDDSDQVIKTSVGQLSNGTFVVTGITSGDRIVSSFDSGKDWDEVVELYLEDDGEDDFDIRGLKWVNDTYLSYCTDVVRNQPQATAYYEDAPNQDGSYNVTVPLVAISESPYTTWKIYGPNYWVMDFSYRSANLTEVNPFFVGVGKGGTFVSQNGWDWQKTSEVNGACTNIASRGGASFLTVCSNTDSTSGETDMILKYSQDGQNWENWNSPCQTSSRSNMTIVCDTVQYIPIIDLFLLYSASATGTIYATQNMMDWWQLDVPYAVGIKEISSDFVFETLAILTNDVVFTGSVSDMTLTLIDLPAVYNGNTTDSLPDPSFPTSGLLITLPEADDDDDDGLSGGAITGIVLGTLAGVGILILTVIVIAVVGFLAYRRHTTKEKGEDARLIHEDL